jgi:predicted NBD/HSP70 family sugar kinase
MCPALPRGPLARPGARWIGLDLGGTKIEAAVLHWNEDGLLIVEDRPRIPTQSHEGYEALVERVGAFVERVAAGHGLEVLAVPIGIGMPGGVRRRDGTIKNSNTTCLNGRPFRSDLEQRLGRAIAFENDANCFALAEALLGAGHAHRGGVVFGVIMGTGVGGGLVCGGKLWPGPQGIAGEWGHHAVYAIPSSAVADLNPCYCGQRGCLETYVSGPAVERYYQALSGRHQSLKTIAAHQDSDAHAHAAFEQLLDAFGRGVANVIDVVDPSVVVLGGGLSNLELLYERGVERVRRYVFNDELMTPIVRNELGDSAGVIGAGLLVVAHDSEAPTHISRRG